MNPRKSKELIPEIAQDLGMDKALVSDVVDFFFRQTRKVMTNMEHTHISIPELGIFRSRPKSIKARIKKLDSIISRTNPETMRGMKILQDLQHKRELLQNNLILWEKEFQRKQQVKEKRYGVIQPDLEKQGKDNRGDEEQSVQETGS